MGKNEPFKTHPILKWINTKKMISTTTKDNFDEIINFKKKKRKERGL